MIKEYEKLYKDLISEFLLKIPDKIPKGITCPMIPCVGDYYEKARNKIAFFGMETRGWGDLNKFKSKFTNNIDGGFNNLTEDFKALSFVDWTNNFHTSFWDYVLTFLSRFYKLENVKYFNENEDGQNILRSFIWGNTNSIESYEVTAEKHDADKKIWDVVKKESKIFDSAQYILKTCMPHIMIIMNWNQVESWLLGENENIKGLELDDHLIYYYLKKSQTHVYWLSHPHWLSYKKRFLSSIDIIINDLYKKNIFGEKEEVFFSQDNVEIKTKIINKREYIGYLAQFLQSMNTVMSGFELANHLNRNGFKTSYGTKYNGLRGTYTLIRQTYKYFSDNNKQEISDAIATSFVKDNGEYAYK